MPEVIEDIFYTDGTRRVSFWGAHPGPGFVVAKEGYTIRWPDGTVGLPWGARSINRMDRAAVAAYAGAANARGMKGLRP
ncbi:MAG: hypothetical protein AB7U75_14715 [Hyphomicrobiaceae bacterium]